MATSVLVIGESGQGKSASLRNFSKEECILIQAVRKPLPFRNDWRSWNDADKSGNIVVSDNSHTVCEAMQYFAYKLGKKVIVIDDFQYFLTNEFMRRSGEKGFDKFTDIARHAWDIVMTAQSINTDTIVYFLSHSQTDERGMTKCKTIGKLLDEKITLEGLFTIVLKAVRLEGKNIFTTQNDGMDTVKTPMGMFDSEHIDNDLKAVDTSIREYYSIGI